MKKLGKIISKTLIIIVLVALVAAGGGYAYLKYTGTQSAASSLASVQTVKLATGTISTTVSATGSVRTRQTSQVTWQASGKVGKVLVAVGDTVKANDVIASLDPTALPSTIITAQEDLATAQQALTDLKNNQSDLPTAELAVLTAQTAVDTAQKARDYLNYPHGTTSQVAAAEASYLLAKQKVDQLQAFYNATPGDPTTEAAKALALSNLSAAKTAMDSAEYNLEWIKGTGTASEIAAADTNLALAKAKLADAQATVAKLKNGPDASSLASAEQRISADQATINSQYVYAPFAGTLSTISSMVGDTVSAGTSAFRVDDTTAYFIDLAVSEVDIAKVQAGQTATITFDAIADKTYTGTVTNVGTVGATSNSVVNFTVTLQVTDADDSIKTGMTASSDLVVTSVSDALVVPTNAVRTVKNQKVVYILTTAHTTGSTAVVRQVLPVKVETGASDDTQTQIISSQLKVGDLIVTNPTTATTTPAASSTGTGLSGLLGGLLGGGPTGGRGG